MLETLASTVERTNQFTDEVRIVREISNRFDVITNLVDPDQIRSAIAEFLPNATTSNDAEDADAPECIRFATEFIAAFPG